MVKLLEVTTISPTLYPSSYWHRTGHQNKIKKKRMLDETIALIISKTIKKNQNT